MMKGSDAKRIKGMNFLVYFFCVRSRARLDHRKKLDRATAQLEKEMDLGRFIQK